MSDTVAAAHTDPTARVLALAAELFDHARSGETAELVVYVGAGIPVGLRDQAGNSLLMMAAYYGHADTVTALAGLGADVDQANDHGQTPLAGAVFKRHLGVVEVLTDLGADPFRGTPSAFEAAVAYGLTDLVARFTRP